MSLRNRDPIDDIPDGCLMWGCLVFSLLLVGIVGGLVFVIWVFGFWLIS